jgi:hypothetical protein
MVKAENQSVFHRLSHAGERIADKLRAPQATVSFIGLLACWS